MSKLFCAYSDNGNFNVPADHRCDVCGKLLCKICGYTENDRDYCNECWQINLKQEANELLPSE